MTPEQKQRIEQIRERHLRVDCYKSQMRTDIDFLLSLVKSQAADRHKRRNPYSEECRAAIDELERLFESEEVELCSIDYVYQREDHSATSMRSACVEKVKAMRDEWEAKRNTSEPLSKLRNRYDAAFCAANEILTELESLSIEKPKE